MNLNEIMQPEADPKAAFTLIKSRINDHQSQINVLTEQLTAFEAQVKRTLEAIRQYRTEIDYLENALGHLETGAISDLMT